MGVIRVVIAALVIIILIFVDISIIQIPKFLNTLISNLKTISLFISNNIQLFALLIVVGFIVFLLQKYSVSITNVTFGYFQFSLKNQDKIIKDRVRNYLNTKRSLFCIKEKYDNFCEVFNSYHDIYVFLRNQLVEYDKTNKKDSDVYKEIITMISELNCFLTMNQSHYRNWYQQYLNLNRNDIYKLELSEIQKKYPKYRNLINDFNDLNGLMKNHAEHFDIEVIDWDEDTLRKKNK